MDAEQLREASVLALPSDLLEAVVCASWSIVELARLAATHRRFSPLIRRILRDRMHPIWRLFCANEAGTVFEGVADYPSLYFKLRKLMPRNMPTMDKLQFVVNINLLVADAEGGESNELVFSELLHGMDATPSHTSEEGEIDIDWGFKWKCSAADKMLVALGGAEGAVKRYQLETINSDGDFPPARLRLQWMPQEKAARAGRRSWRLSLTAFDPTNQSVYRLLDEALPNPDYSTMGGPGDWSTHNFSFQHQPLRFVTSALGPQGAHGLALEYDWHAHASLVPPCDDAAQWELHFHVTEDSDQNGEWRQNPSDLVVTALENLHWT